MLVEDDRFFSTLLKTRLEKEGFSVMQAFDGEEATTLLQTNKPNLIIMDLIMPKMNGFEVLQTMSIMPEMQKIPVVIVSNLAQDSDVQKASELGAKEYFVKAKIPIDSLIQEIKKLVGQPEQASPAVPQP